MSEPRICSCSQPPRRPGERGFVMLYVVYVVLAVGLFLAGAIAYMGNAIHRGRAELGYHGHALNVARAGLADAVNWFKSQASQPVRSSGSSYAYADAAFHPLHDNTPKLNFTDDESIGLVKEVPLSDDDRLWGRYEVRRQLVDNGTDPALTDSNAVHDITSYLGKGNAGEGLAWHIQANAFVYLKNDPNRAFNQAPNRVLETVAMAEQIISLSIRRPAESAIIVGTASGISIGTNARITGMPNGYAVTYRAGTGTPSPATAPGGVTGAPSAYLSLPDSLWFDDVQRVFGVTQSEIRSLASITVSSVASLPATLPSMAIVYIDGAATFTPTRPLTGGGILFVNGNLTIQANSNSLFSGFIYCTGRVYQYAPSLISGMVVAHGGYTISGAGDVAQAEYSPSVLSAVRDHLCQYQEAKAPYVVQH
ncbi:MAG: hypothetical protein HZB25_10335 [Candidatus Eisenbacteria bacterium]|nr:hypothetical protein [Candidatus Eisenbacteria bacterium]